MIIKILKVFLENIIPRYFRKFFKTLCVLFVIFICIYIPTFGAISLVRNRISTFFRKFQFRLNKCNFRKILEIV